MSLTSLNRCTASSAKVGSGLCSVSHAISSFISLGIGCSTMTMFFSFSQKIISRAIARSFQPWLTSTAIGRHVTERMVSINSLSWSLPSFTFKILNLSAHSLVFCFTISGESIPIVKVVDGVLSRFSPQILYQGAFSIFPTRSCNAMSIAAFAAVSPGERLST